MGGAGLDECGQRESGQSERMRTINLIQLLLEHSRLVASFKADLSPLAAPPALPLPLLPGALSGCLASPADCA